MKNDIPKYLTSLGSSIAVAINAHAQYIYTELVYPGIDNAVADGVDGANIVGYYWDDNNVSHGFLYTTTNWSTLDAPSAGKSSGQGTFPFGISGSRVVGY